MKKKYLVLIGLAISNLGNAQNRTIDSLKQLAKTAINDTTKINVFMQLGDKFQGITLDTAFLYHKKAKELSLKTKDAVREADAIRQIGWDYYLNGNYDSAIANYDIAIAICNKYINTSDNLLQRRAKKVKAAATGNKGGTFYAKGDYPLALDHYFKALHLAEEIGNKKIIASNYANIGVVYDELKEYTKALNSYLKALKLVEELNNKVAMAISLGNIGTTYYKLKDFTKSLEYQNRAFALNEQIGRSGGAASNVGNMGMVYEKMGNRNKAYEYYNEGLKRNNDLGNKEGVCINMANIGSLQNKDKKYKEAEKTLNEAFKIAEGIDNMEMIKSIHHHLSYLYENTNRSALALLHYKNYIGLRDSMLNEESIKAGAQKELQFEFDKKTTSDSLRVVGEKKVMNAQLAQEKTQRFALYGGLALLFVFAGFMYNRFKITASQKRIIEAKEKETQKQYEIITHQKHLVDEKQKEILDSINYASRIQKALLAPEKYINNSLKRLNKKKAS